MTENTKEKYVCVNNQFFSLKIIFKARLVSESAFLRFIHFHRHPYKWSDVIYGNYGHYGNIAIMAIIGIWPQLPQTPQLIQCHRYWCLQKRLDHRNAAPDTNLPSKVNLSKKTRKLDNAGGMIFPLYFSINFSHSFVFLRMGGHK